MKGVLSEYSIDNSEKSLIEQYRSTEGDITEIIKSAILAQFTAMGAERKGMGSYFPQSLIDDYNKTAQERLH